MTMSPLLIYQERINLFNQSLIRISYELELAIKFGGISQISSGEIVSPLAALAYIKSDF